MRDLFILGVSYNQPKLSACATWNPNAVTFVNASGSSPHNIYVDMNNTVYVAETTHNRVRIWLNGSTTPSRTISGSLSSPYAVFASIIGVISIDNGELNHRVDTWTSNATNSTVKMYVNGTCYGLFVDIYDDFYCSTEQPHIVLKKLMMDNPNTTIVVAGSTTNHGAASDRLLQPRGIFVTINLDLYVADCGNHRIQLFRSGQRNGTTIAGQGAPGTITLNSPTGVILDANEHIFIVEHRNHRVVRSGSDGFQCILGCTGTSGSASNQLNYPHALNFDSDGNIFVADTSNNRIQKFLLATNSCGKYFLLTFVVGFFTC